MKKQIVSVIALLTVVTEAMAFDNSSFEKDGLYYNVLSDGKTLEVAKPLNPSDYHGDIAIPETVEHEGKTYTVTAIESRAFFRNMELTSLKIPQTMRTIGEDAFWDCDSLKTVDIGSLSNWCTIDFQGDLWFSNPISRVELEHLLVDGEEITDLVIPDDVEEISRNAFYWCPPIQSLEIPGTVKTIGEDAFHRCYNLRKVVLHEGIEYVKKGGLANMRAPTISIPMSVTRMDKNALNYKNTESWLRNVCLLNPRPDAITLTDDIGLESTLISVPTGALDAYKNHNYWGQFSIVEGFGEDDFSKGVVRLDFFYAEEPLVKRNSNGYFAPTIHGYPGYQSDGELTCDFGLGLYQDGQLKYITWRFWDNWTFVDWKTCNFTSWATLYIHDIADERNYNLADGNYQMRMLYKIKGDEEWIPMVNSDHIYIDVTVSGDEMTLRNRYIDKAKLRLDSFAVNGMPKIGHDMTASATVTNEGICRNGCLYLHVNDTTRSFIRPVIKQQETTEMTFENYVFKPQSPGTYKFEIINGEGEVLAQRDISIPIAEKNHLELAKMDVENLFGEFMVSKENLSIDVEVKNVGDTPYNDELKFVTRMIWGFYEEGDTLISNNGSVYCSLVAKAGESGTCHFNYIDYDYYNKIGISPYPPYNSSYSVEVYYYSEGKEVLLAKTPYMTWINPEEYEGKILIKPVGFTREYGEENPKIEYSVYGGTLTGEPHIYTEASTDSPAKHYEIKCEQGSVTNDDVVYGTGVMKVTKAPLIITAKSYTREQGEENPVFELSYSGFKNGETEAVLTKAPTVVCEATEASAPGEYSVEVTGGESQNYEISYVSGTLTVEPADPVTVTAVSYTRVYGDENPVFGFTSEGAPLEGQPEIICEATSASPVGTYPIIISKGDVANYNDTYVNGTLTITKAPLTVSGGVYTKKQGEAMPAFTVTYEGFKNGETEAVLMKAPTVVCEATEASAPGEYSVEVTGAEAQNYDITYVNGKLTVTVPSGIPEVLRGETFDVYTTSGILVKRKTTSFNGLAKGVYVVNGRKVIVR